MSISTVNGGNPFGSNATNPDLYRNNDPSDSAAAILIEADGLTVVLGAQASITAATLHHMKIAIADGSDSILNSWVFIEGGSFNCAPLTASLSVIKVVDNTGGGTRMAGDFTLHLTDDNAGDADVPESPFSGQVSPGTEFTLPAGTYSVREDARPDYITSLTGDCTAVVLGGGDTKTCTVTNTFLIKGRMTGGAALGG